MRPLFAKACSFSGSLLTATSILKQQVKLPRFYFEPSARLQRFLGRELISDPNLAVAEFIKNAYDAGATEVYVDFTLKGIPKESHVLTISDSGKGMDVQAFKENWMRPGYSEKAKPKALGKEGRP